MANYTRDEILKLLREGVYFITFTKKNGEERVMECTLLPRIISEYDFKLTHRKEPNDNVIACFDVQKSSWRSFRVDSVIKVE